MITGPDGLHHLFLTVVPGVFEIQVVELHEANGRLTCDRDTPTYINLIPPPP